jgi:RHS repeat-associated protein
LNPHGYILLIFLAGLILPCGANLCTYGGADGLFLRPETKGNLTTDLTFGYSPDGAKDLTAATWPQLTSGVFNFPAVTQSYGYDRAGRVNSIGDASGARAITYQNGRLAETAWNSGDLSGFKLVHGLDASGRDTGFSLYQGSSLIHSAAQVSNGLSGESASLSSGTFNAIFTRDTARHLTSITRGAVTQNWTRDLGGRITAATSNVAGAPAFTYANIDAKGRRLTSATSGGSWAYQYTAGQLTSAVHPTLGSFSYQFDGIGRRTDKGSANTSDLLNRTLAWTNNQSKTLQISAAPAANVWVGIGTAAATQLPNFTGSFTYPIPSPGPAGGWVAWNTLAVLPGQGDPGANPDAKAAQNGAIWVPPISESFSYDSAGNRQSTARWDLGWDGKNQLTRVRTKNHSTAPQGYDVTNAYDSEGRRFSQKINRTQAGSVVAQVAITYLHDGNDLIYERHQLPSGLTLLERKYLWGPDLSGSHGGAGGAGGLLLIRETKGNITTDLYPLYDGSGNVTALADTTGTFQAEYAYGPFGETIYARGPKAQSCPFRFATKYYDQETGYYNFGRRFYDPTTGQFLSREPLGETESLNLYSYCGNDPINYVDVDGLWRINTQEAANSQRVEWLLMQLSAGSGLPTAPLDEWKLYFPESGDFGLHRPYGPEDYKRAQTFVQNLGRPSMRPMTADQAAAARQPSFGPAPEWIPSATAALTLGAANTPLNASINSDWLLPTGAGAAGAKFLFGGMKSILPILAAGARTEGRLLTADLRAGEISSKGFGAIGFDKLPVGATSSTLRDIYLKEASSGMFKAKLGIQNFLTRGSVTPVQIAEQLTSNTDFRLVSNIGRSNINLVGDKFVVGGVESWGYLSRTITHHEMMHMSQFIRNPNITTTGLGAMRHEILPSFIGTPEIYGGTSVLLGGAVYWGTQR